MTGNELKRARRELGLSVRDMAAALRLSETNGEREIRRMERDEKIISGPISVAVEAMLNGYVETYDEPDRH